MSKQINLQDVFLNKVRKDKITITVFLTNGFQFKGTVLGFDNYIIIMNVEGKQQLVYKHALSTVIPSVSISILDSQKEYEVELENDSDSEIAL